MIKRGDLVEFSVAHHHDWPPYDHSLQLFGVAVEDQQPDGSVLVERSNGRTARARHIYAYAWAGWVPPGLEAAYDRINAVQEET